MNKKNFSFACWDYDRIQPLVNNSIKIEGIDLNWLNLPVEEIFFRTMRYQEFDIAELSLSSYLISKDKGISNYTAIPVFISRFFRHSNVFINVNSGINSPEDLKGKRIGIPEYQLTANLWIRGFLQHDYGVKPSDVHWLTGGQESPGRIEKVPLDLPVNIKIEAIEKNKTLNEMLENNEIDAFIGPRTPSCYLEGSPNVKRLFEDYLEVEKAYYKRTNIFPIMHVVAIKNDILKKHPWVAQNLYKAFVKAKNQTYESLTQTAALKVMLPFLVKEIEETKILMGEDYWPYGIEANKKTLEAAINYSLEQGLIKNKIDLKNLFVNSTFDSYKI